MCEVFTKLIRKVFRGHASLGYVKPINVVYARTASTPCVLAMEHIMEHVARTINKEPLAVKQLNFYTVGQASSLSPDA